MVSNRNTEFTGGLIPTPSHPKALTPCYNPVRGVYKTLRTLTCARAPATPPRTWPKSEPASSYSLLIQFELLHPRCAQATTNPKAPAGTTRRALIEAHRKVGDYKSSATHKVAPPRHVVVLGAKQASNTIHCTTGSRVE
jgi:hypothetical protein